MLPLPLDNVALLPGGLGVPGREFGAGVRTASLPAMLRGTRRKFGAPSTRSGKLIFCNPLRTSRRRQDFASSVSPCAREETYLKKSDLSKVNAERIRPCRCATNSATSSSSATPLAICCLMGSKTSMSA